MALATDDFKRAFHGQVLLPSDDGYDAARSLWNGDIDRKPAVIARCTSTDDVAAAIGFARAHQLEIAVRGTPDEVHEGTLNVLEGSGGEGIILSVGGGVSPGMPRENVLAMLEALDEFNVKRAASLAAVR